VITNYKLEYIEHLKLKLFKEFNYINIHQVPKLEKIIISCCLGINAQNKKYLEEAIEEMRIITGQHPILTKSKKAISNFKLKKDAPLGLVTTLRRDKMYYFLEKIIKLVFPRLKDFRGLNKNQFDKNGNYSFGLEDQLIFPELNYDKMIPKRGFNVTIVTTAKSSEESFFLLNGLGFPFKKNL